MDSEDKSVSKIRPGTLVSLHSTLNGGIEYKRIDLGNTVSVDGVANSKWETEKTILSVEEYERGTKVRGRAVSLIRACCAATNFGLLCADADLPALNTAVIAARNLAEEYNASSVHSRISIYVLKGRIASTDEEAIKSLSEEVRSLLDTMSDGIAKTDAKVIRDACAKATAISSMLAEEQSRSVSKAVEEARTAAREIVRRVEKRGEDATRVLASIQTRAIANARMAFLDLDDDLEVKGQPMPQVNVARFQVDIDEEPTEEELLQSKLTALEAKVAKLGVQE